MRKKIIRNVVCALLLQVVTMISGFVVPKIILLSFGSEINGLISSITQFLSYITLLEGGLSGVIMAALYRPLRNNDVEQISAVVKAADQFFKKIALLYLLYVAILAISYPLIVKQNIGYLFIFCLVLVLAINLFTQYFFSLTYRLLIQASQKDYIVSIVQIIIVLANMLLTALLTNIYPDIIVIKLISSIVYFIQPIVFTRYVYKNYKLKKKVNPDKIAIKQRWDGFGQNLAFFIHTNTDIVLLTFFLPISEISVYAVYMMVINALKNLIISMSKAIVPTIGHTIAGGNIKEINKVIDIYEFGVFFVTTLLFASGVSLINPFISVYTKDITDANYYQPVFAVVMILAEAVYCLRDPYVSIAYAAGHFRQTKKYAYFEAVINIIISLLLVKQLGMIGVAIGTLIAMIYRTFMHVLYAKNNISYRNISKGIKMICMSITLILLIYYFCQFLFIGNTISYFDWFVLAIKTGIIAFLIVFIFSIIFYRKITIKFFVSVKKRFVN